MTEHNARLYGYAGEITMVQEFLGLFTSLPPAVQGILISAGGTFATQFLTALGTRSRRLVAGPEIKRRLALCYQAATGLLVETLKGQGWSETRLEALTHVLGLDEVEQRVAQIVAGKSTTEETGLGEYFRVGVIRPGEISTSDKETQQFIGAVISGSFLPQLYGLLAQTIKDPDIQVAEIMAWQRHLTLVRSLESMRLELLQVVGRTSPPSYPRAAYGKRLSGHMLSRERLDERDFRKGDAVKPPKVDGIVDALKRRESVAVQGPPGSGKSALAAWVNWEGEKQGLSFAYYGGRELQEGDPGAHAVHIGEAPPDHVLIIDDIHLAQKVLPHLRLLFGERRFLLLGRTNYVDEAYSGGLLPIEDERPINITDSDSEYIVKNLVRKYVPDEGLATRLLDRTGKDLVYTKWLLEEVILRHANPESTPRETAIHKLETLDDEWGQEFVRLFLTLAAFGWVELPCPETFLVSGLGFDLNTLKNLYKGTREAERSRRGHVLKLRRHPKLCELFLKVAPHLLAFDQRIFARTCEVMSLESDTMRSHEYGSLVLGAWGANRPADLDSIAWRLIYAGRGSDYMKIVKAAVDVYHARSRSRPAVNLSLDERIRRLTLAYSATNGERRLHRGQAARVLLEQLLGQLGVADIPVEPFEDKGNILFQDAYIMRLNNAGQHALDRFGESAKVDEEWALANDSPVYRGKAAMSCTAAAYYCLDFAVFSDPTSGSLNPNCNLLADISNDLRAAVRTQKDLLSGEKIDEKKRELVEGFRTNGLVILAEAAGWMGDESTVNACLDELSHIQYYKRRVIGHLAKGALAYMKGEYEQVIVELEGKDDECVKLGAAEGAGKMGVLLLLSYLKTNKARTAEDKRSWLLSDKCPADGGNGLAKDWATRLTPSI